MTFEHDAGRRLAALDAEQLLRWPMTVQARRGAHIEVDGAWLVNFSSNDYLGYADDVRIREAGRRELERSGAGATASRLVVGNLPAHVELEGALRDWLGVEGICLFNSGYAANTGVLAALMRPGDVIVSDRLNHASIIDGCKLSGAEVRIYQHLSCEDLEQKLVGLAGRRCLVVTESIFSMDGDRPDLVRIAALCERYGAGLLVDEAHAIGVIGPGGRGECARQGVVPDLLIGTFGKALGVYGAFVATTPNLSLLLWNRARSLVFTTGLPPAVVAMCSAAVRLVQSADGDAKRQALAANVAIMSEIRTEIEEHSTDILQVSSENRTRVTKPVSTHIIPIVLVDQTNVMAKSTALRAHGMLVSVIRPPTVPVGTSRFRICLSANHSQEQISRLLQVIENK
ncbi:MAG: 8-amino-7-oxononanoate synthase [Kofleriaceae bacterium]|nr:8-amino-7-oxononanoate synthase [Kofleriaceae bacterium]